MSAEISLFSGYGQKENRTTNYCLLVLRMLYEENPKFLAEVLEVLFDDETIAAKVGVKFQQQIARERSSPDGLIIQQAFTVYIETKHFDWFYQDQLKRHLHALKKEQPGLKVLLALGSFAGATRGRFAEIEKLCSGYAGEIVFRAAGFEDLLNAIKRIQLPKNLQDTVNDFQAYLDEEKLLPTWQSKLDVVNCATSLDRVVSRQAYICPALGGSYNHSRCRFIGLYAEKRVQYVAEIRGVVDVDDDGGTTLLWNNGVDGNSDTSLCREAVKIADAVPREKHSRRLFLLGIPRETDLRKDSKGGMLASKLYFDISRFGAKSAEELALALRGKTWSEFEH